MFGPTILASSGVTVQDALTQIGTIVTEKAGKIADNVLII